MCYLNASPDQAVADCAASAGAFKPLARLAAGRILHHAACNAMPAQALPPLLLSPTSTLAHCRWPHLRSRQHQLQHRPLVASATHDNTRHLSSPSDHPLTAQLPASPVHPSCSLLSSTPLATTAPIPPPDPTSLQLLLGYRFLDAALLRQACTHDDDPGALSYRQLGFVGDAALNLLFAQHLMEAHHQEDPRRWV